jgi:DNA-binding beta-propeller fold protein YncE
MRKFLIASAILLAALPLTAAGKRVVIVQTNSAGDNVHLIDPATNKVMGVINGIEANHGAAVAPDGARLYVSNEADSTLDFVDGKTLKVIKKSRWRRTASACMSASSRRRAAWTSSTPSRAPT